MDFLTAVPFHHERERDARGGADGNAADRLEAAVPGGLEVERLARQGAADRPSNRAPRRVQTNGQQHEGPLGRRVGSPAHVDAVTLLGGAAGRQTQDGDADHEWSQDRHAPRYTAFVDWVPSLLA